MSLEALQRQLDGLKDNLKPHFRKRLKEMDQGYRDSVGELRAWCEQSASTSSFSVMSEHARKARPDYLRVGVYQLVEGKLPACVEFSRPHLCFRHTAERTNDAVTLVQKLLLRISVDMAGDRPFIHHLDFTANGNTEDLFPGLLNRQVPARDQLSLIAEEYFRPRSAELELSLPTRILVLSGLPGKLTEDDIDILQRFYEVEGFSGYWVWLMFKQQEFDNGSELEQLIKAMPTFLMDKQDEVKGFESLIHSELVELKLDNEVPNDLYQLAREWIR